MTDAPNVPWTTKAQVVALPAYEALQDEDDTKLALLCDVASAWLWRATGRRWSGSADAVVRPLPFRWSGSSFTSGWPGQIENIKLGYSGPSSGCWCSAYEVSLGFLPVTAVTEVVIDGAVVAPSTYRLDEQRLLVRTDGLTWPSWNDLRYASAAVTGHAGTWQVALTWGEAPPADAAFAATVLAGELGLSVMNSSSCRLNPRVQSVSRQNTSMLLMDPMTLLAGEKWGVKELDNLVAMLNPHNLAQRTAVLDPQSPTAVRVVG